MAGLSHGWDYPDTHADFKHGGVDIDDFDAEVNYQKRIAKKNKKAKKRYPGCPENNNGPHVYVWTTEFRGERLFKDYFGFHKYEEKRCAGCGHKDSSRLTEEYNARNSKEFTKYKRKNPNRRYLRLRWWRFETYDEGFKNKERSAWQRWGYGKSDYFWEW
jgi:hypothetical protein